MHNIYKTATKTVKCLSDDTFFVYEQNVNTYVIGLMKNLVLYKDLE